MLQCGISFQWEIRGGQLNRPIYMWKSSLAAATIRHWASTALLLTWNFNEFEKKKGILNLKFKVTLWSVWSSSGLQLHCGGYQCANKIGFGSVWNGGLSSFRFNDWLVPFPSAAYRCQYIQSLKYVGWCPLIKGVYRGESTMYKCRGCKTAKPWCFGCIRRQTAMDKGQKLDDGLQCPPRAARWGFRRSQVGFRRDGFSSTIQAAPPTNQPCCTVHTCTAFHPLHSCAAGELIT